MTDPEQQSSDKGPMRKVAIVGGGIAGVTAALALAAQGYRVYLFETLDEYLLGASNNTPCRVGAGLHYIDPESAKSALRSTVKFLRNYGDYLLKVPENLSGSDYVIVKESVKKYGNIAATHGAIVEEYERLVDEDPKNQVLGKPDELIDHKEERPSYLLNVKALYKTNEQILDWQRLREDLIEKVDKHPNIITKRACEVKQFEYAASSTNKRFTITYMDKTSGKTETLDTDYIINCAWQNTEKLNHSLHVPYKPESRTIRLKAMAKIRLPKHLENIRTSFCCFGPHAAITNVGDGIAYVTYEPETNMAQSTELEITDDMKFWLEQGNQLNIDKQSIATNENSRDKYNKGMAILGGAANYFSGLQGAELLDVSYGVVKTSGIVDIHDPKSPHHARNEPGVSEQMLGLITSESVKLLKFTDSLEKAMASMQAQTEFTQRLEGIFADPQLQQLGAVKRKAITDYYGRYYNGFFGGCAHSHLDSQDLSKQASAVENISPKTSPSSSPQQTRKVDVSNPYAFYQSNLEQVITEDVMQLDRMKKELVSQLPSHSEAVKAGRLKKNSSTKKIPMVGKENVGHRIGVETAQAPVVGVPALRVAPTGGSKPSPLPIKRSCSAEAVLGSTNAERTSTTTPIVSQAPQSPTRNGSRHR